MYKSYRTIRCFAVLAGPDRWVKHAASASADPYQFTAAVPSLPNWNAAVVATNPRRARRQAGLQITVRH